MSVKSFVLSQHISGVDESDLELNIHQLAEESDYEIDNPVEYIANHMFLLLEPYLDDEYVVEDMIDILSSSDGNYSLDVSDTYGVDIRHVIVNVNNKYGVYYFDMVGDFVSRQIYSIRNIDECRVGYLVEDHMIHPQKGCKLLRRCYAEVFRDIVSAKEYLYEAMSNYHIELGSPLSGFRIIVVDVDELADSDWYNKNIDAYSFMQKYNINPDCYRYSKSIDDVIGDMRIKAYDYLPPDECDEIDRDIYYLLRPYILEINSNHVMMFDENMLTANDGEFYEIADDAIKYSLLNATSKAMFDDIHVTLRQYEWRIRDLTADVRSENGNAGYIVITKYGEIGWYCDCYAVNAWQRAMGNPYYGVFQKNDSDVLLCLREYHPEMVVDKLPTTEYMEKYRQSYLEYKKEKRIKEFNLRYEVDNNGDKFVIGTWYYYGLYRDCFLENTRIPARYGSHEFTEDECRKLFFGEELVVDNYVSKIGHVFSIRGKLLDCSDSWDDEKRIDFVRTDIDFAKRRKMYL